MPSAAFLGALLVEASDVGGSMLVKVNLDVRREAERPSYKLF